MTKIIGNPTVTPMAIPDWNQTDVTKADYIKNKPNIPTKLSDLEDDSEAFPIEYSQNAGFAMYSQSSQTSEFANKATYDGVGNDIIDTYATKAELLEEIADIQISGGSVQSDWDETNTESMAYIKNKPTIPESIHDLRDDTEAFPINMANEAVKAIQDQHGIPIDIKYATKEELSITQEIAEDAHSKVLNAETELYRIEGVAKGRSTGYVFDTVENMNAWLEDSNNVVKLILGDNLYIRATDVPDYWWDGESAQLLETQKVDLTEFVKIDVTPISKLVDDTNQNPISKAQFAESAGYVETAASATEANWAATAQNDENGNKIIETYATKNSSYRINVKDFGAVGDGATDDTAAIQSALNFCNENGGGTIFVPCGTYIVSATLNVYSNTVILGENPRISIIKGNGILKNAPLIKAVGTSSSAIQNVVLDNLRFEYGFSTGSTDNLSDFDKAETIVAMRYIRNSTIRNCAFTNFAKCAILIMDTRPAGQNHSVNIKDNYIYENGWNREYGILLDTGSEYCEVTGNRIAFCSYAITMRNAANNRVICNNVTQCMRGIAYNTSDNWVNGGKFVITDNTINHCSEGGITATIRAHTEDFKESGGLIANNMIILCDNYGIKVAGGESHLITGNKIITSNDTDKGIYLLDNTASGQANAFRNSFVTGNLVECTKTGTIGKITNESTGSGNLIENNLLVDKTTA